MCSVVGIYAAQNILIFKHLVTISRVKVTFELKSKVDSGQSPEMMKF